MYKRQAQYTPCGELDRFPELCRPITRREQEKVEGVLFDLGLEGFTQERKARGQQYIPDWDMASPQDVYKRQTEEMYLEGEA